MRYRFGGLIFGGAYTWKGLFSEFFGIFYRPREGDTLVLEISFFALKKLAPAIQPTVSHKSGLR